MKYILSYHQEFRRLASSLLKVICNKNDNGKYKWSGDLGGCKAVEAATTAKPDVTGDNKPSCKDIELRPAQVNSGIAVAYKVNSCESVFYLKNTR